MGDPSRIEKVLVEKREDLLRYIKSRISRHLWAHILPEEILAETVRYALENERTVEKRADEQQVFLFLMWKAQLVICDRIRDLQRDSRIYSHEDSWMGRGEEQTNSSHLEPSPTFLLHRRDKSQAIQKYLALLASEEQRTAILLVRIQGLSVEEAALAMGKTNIAVRQLLKRGLANLAHKVRSSGGRKFETTGKTS